MKKNILKIEHPHNFHMVGDGFRVMQYLPGYGRPMSPTTSPFLMLDYNAPWHIPPQGEHRPGVGFHPHRGFETVTVVYSGEIEHEDTAGNGGIIGAGEVQWMTAGSGLLHNEFMTENFSKTGGVQHAVQLWIDLPKEDKMTAPRYQALTKENIPEVIFDGGRARVIAGELKLSLLSSRMQGSETEGNVAIQEFESLDCFVPRNDEIIIQNGIAKTHSPIELYDIIFESAGDITLHFPHDFRAFALVVAGTGFIQDKSIQHGDMLTFSLDGDTLSLKGDISFRILVMAGKPLGQNVVNHGPFVMTTPEEIEEAFKDFQSGKMG